LVVLAGYQYVEASAHLFRDIGLGDALKKWCHTSGNSRITSLMWHSIQRHMPVGDSRRSCVPSPGLLTKILVSAEEETGGSHLINDLS